MTYANRRTKQQTLRTTTTPRTPFAKLAVLAMALAGVVIFVARSYGSPARLASPPQSAAPKAAAAQRSARPQRAPKPVRSKIIEQRSDRAFELHVAPRKGGEAGVTLIEMLIVVAIMSILATLASSLITQLVQGARHVEIRGDLEAIRRAISDGLDCDATFAAAGIDPNDPAMCSSTSLDQRPTYLRLMRSSRDGTVLPFTAALAADGSGKLGAWRLRASCSASERSLVIQAARVLADGTFAKDPMTGRVLDWGTKRAVLFGGDFSEGFVPLCYGKGALTGKIIHGVQRYEWNAGTGRFDVRALNGSAAAEPGAVTTVRDGANGLHGLRCDPARGWKTISCHVNTLNYGILSDDAGTFFDVDAFMGSDEECWTNEVQDFATLGVRQHGRGISVHVSCVKVGN